MSSEQKNVHCKICGNRTGNCEYRPREMMYGRKDVFHYFQCAKCHCLQIAEFPPDISKYYDDSYYSYESLQKPNTVFRYLIGLRDAYALFKNGFVGKMLFTLRPSPSFDFLASIHPTRKTSVLDVGCGSGALLSTLYNAGLKNVLGADFFIEKDINYGNGLTIRKLDFQEVNGKWDVIMFHHSFEHLPDPRNTLLHAYQLLNAGGYCIIQMPTVSSYAWNHYGVNWVQLDAPRHFFLHSRESIEILCKAAGLELVKIVYTSTAFQFWGSEQYMKGIPLLDARSYYKDPLTTVFSKEEFAEFGRRAERLNAESQGDQAMFYLRKA